MGIPTPPAIVRLLDPTDEPARTLLLCAVLRGMRRGDLLGLRCDDVNLEGILSTSARAVAREFVTPKSRRSRRATDVASTLQSAVTRLSSRFNGGLEFCSSDGKRPKGLAAATANPLSLRGCGGWI
jgi:integrase